MDKTYSFTLQGEINIYNVLNAEIFKNRATQAWYQTVTTVSSRSVTLPDSEAQRLSLLTMYRNVPRALHLS
jgi:hypothetical protein